MPSNPTKPPPPTFPAEQQPSQQKQLAAIPRGITTHVVKRLSPTQPGAIKLAERFGSQLVCVRYRHDLEARQRYTTVELVVDAGSIRSRAERARPAKRQIVALQFANNQDWAFRKHLLKHGAVWDGNAGIWYLSKATARELDLMNWVV